MLPQRGSGLDDVARERVGPDVRDPNGDQAAFERRAVAGEEAELVLPDPSHRLGWFLGILALH